MEFRIQIFLILKGFVGWEFWLNGGNVEKYFRFVANMWGLTQKMIYLSNTFHFDNRYWRYCVCVGCMGEFVRLCWVLVADRPVLRRLQVDLPACHATRLPETEFTWRRWGAAHEKVEVTFSPLEQSQRDHRSRLTRGLIIHLSFLSSLPIVIRRMISLSRSHKTSMNCLVVGIRSFRREQNYWKLFVVLKRIIDSHLTLPTLLRSRLTRVSTFRSFLFLHNLHFPPSI